MTIVTYGKMITAEFIIHMKTNYYEKIWGIPKIIKSCAILAK